MLTRMLQGVRHFLLAVQFFTRIPITGRLADWVGFSPAMLRASSAHFPGVGWIVAVAATASYGALALALAEKRQPPDITHLFSPTLVRRHSVVQPAETSNE